MGDDFKLAALTAQPWTFQDTMDYLSDHPLPSDFQWQGKLVVPSHATLRGGYGKWLKETPYHRGLFPLIHKLLEPAAVLPRRHELAQNDELVRWINEAVAAQAAQTTLFD